MAEADAQRPCILVVDDEPNVCDSVRDLLRRDYRVLTATSAEEGCRLLRDQSVQVLLTDQRMPRVSGVELLETARAANPQVTRLMFSGFADFDSILAAINQGQVFEFLRKPWNPDTLLDTVRRAVVEAHRQTRLAEETRQMQLEIQTLRARVDQLESEVGRLSGTAPGFG